MKFLIDECLSPALAEEAQAAGFEAYHIAHIGGASLPDRHVMAYAAAHDLTLVTNNASDFRRLYAALELHPGLVVIIPNANRDGQLQLFRAALARLEIIKELINRALEIDADGDRIILNEYVLPRQN